MSPAALVQQLKAIKKRKDLTYPQIAKEIGVHKITLTRWCTGTYPPKAGLVTRVLERWVKRHDGKA